MNEVESASAADADDVSRGLVENGKNLKGVKCQRCPSKILNSGVATYEEKTFLLPHMTKKAECDDPRVGDVLSHYWSVDDIYKFENMGFSNTVGGTTKYLVCADCEMGPIGWHDLDTKVSYVALQRVIHE